MTSRSVLVTGASTGIGEATALLLAENGWRVYAGVRRAEDGERVARIARGMLEPVTLDVTDEAQIDAVVKQIGDDTGGKLNAVVNNAGVGIGGPLEYIAIDDWRRQFEVNVIGQVAVTRATMPLIRAAGPGARIVIIGSIGGRISNPLMGPYNGSKHALEAIAESLRHELRPAHIKVVLIEPGAIATPMWGKADNTGDEIEAALSPEGKARYQQAIDATRKGIRMQTKNAIPARRVAEVVEKALTTERPRARYLVGRDAKAAAAVARFAPDSLRDFLVRNITRP